MLPAQGEEHRPRRPGPSAPPLLNYSSIAKTALAKLPEMLATLPPAAGLADYRTLRRGLPSCWSSGCQAAPPRLAFALLGHGPNALDLD
jgi:hypothetical protein